MVFDGSK
jgi:hypothetical protein